MYLTTRHTVPALRILLAADGAAAGGSGKSLETQLSEAIAEKNRLTGQVDALTKERDTAKAEVTNLTGQFNVAVKEASDAKVEVTKLTGERDTAIKDRDEKATKLTTADANITRLKTLCKIKGVDADAAVPAAEDPNGAGAKGHVFDQWAKASGQAKRALYAEHKTEIRAEARRRGAAADPAD